jgi:hypothetical protein
MHSSGKWLKGQLLEGGVEMLKDVDLTNEDYELLTRAKKFRYGTGIQPESYLLRDSHSALSVLSDLSFATHNAKGEFRIACSSLYDKITAQLEKAEGHPTLTMDDVLGAEKAQLLQDKIDSANEIARLNYELNVARVEKKQIEEAYEFDMDYRQERIVALEGELKIALDASNCRLEQITELVITLEQFQAILHKIKQMTIGFNAPEQALRLKAYVLGAILDHPEYQAECVESLLNTCRNGSKEAEQILLGHFHLLELSQKGVTDEG